MLAPLSIILVIIGICAAFTEGLTASAAPFVLALLNEAALLWWSASDT